MYTVKNYKSKKALKEDVANGVEVRIFAPGLGTPVIDGPEFLEGRITLSHTGGMLR